MKRIWLTTLLIFGMAGIAVGQTTTTSFTTADPDGVAWNAGTYSIQYQNATPGKPYNTSTGQFITTLYTGTLNSSGALSLTLDDVQYVSPANGTWIFTICPDVSGGNSNCATISIPVTGTSENVSSQINAVLRAPRPGGGVGAYGYADVEFQAIPGNTYVVSPALTVQRCYAGSWAACGSGGGGGATFTPSGIQFATSSTAARVASPITDYQVPVAVSLANYSASNLPVTFGNVTNSSNSITVQNAAGWATGMGAFIPAVSTSGQYPATGLTCPYVAVSGNTLTCFQANGTTPINATWTTTGFNLPVYHYNMTTGAVSSSSASLVVGSAATFAVGQGIMVRGAGAAGADLITTISAIAGTTITLSVTASTTVTTANVFHDDTAALAAALAATETIPGSSLRIPAGTYFLSSENDITNAMSFYGDGMYQSAFIVTEDAKNALVIKAGGVTFKDVGMYMSEAITPSSGNLLSLCDIGGTDECFNDNITRLMLYWGWNQFAEYNKGIQDSFSYNTLHAPFNAGIYLNNPPGDGDMNFAFNQIQNANSGSTGQYCILVDAADANSFTSNKCNAFIHDVWITGQLGAVDHLRFDNNSFEDYTSSLGSAIQALSTYPVFGNQFNGGESEEHFYIGNGVQRTQMSNMTFYGSVSGQTSSIDNAGQGTVLSGNTMYGCTGDCFRLEATATNTKAVGNTFDTASGWGINDLETIGSGGPNVAHSNTYSNMTSGNSNVPTYQQVDNFAGAASTALTSHIADTGQTWTQWTPLGGTNSAVLSGSNTVTVAPTTTVGYYSSLVPSSPNYTASMNCTLVNSSGFCAILGRIGSLSQQTNLQLQVTPTTLKIYSIVNTTVVTLATYTSTFSLNTVYNIALVMSGGNVSANVNGTQQIAPTAIGTPSLLAAGNVGIVVGGNSSAVGSNFKVSNNSGLITPLATQEYVQDYVAGLAPIFGYTTLSSGTVTISTTSACTPSATCVYKLTNCGINSSAALGVLTVGTTTAGTSFVINSESSVAGLVTTDNSHVCWQIN